MIKQSLCIEVLSSLKCSFKHYITVYFMAQSPSFLLRFGDFWSPSILCSNIGLDNLVKLLACLQPAFCLHYLITLVSWSVSMFVFLDRSMKSWGQLELQQLRPRQEGSWLVCHLPLRCRTDPPRGSLEDGEWESPWPGTPIETSWIEQVHYRLDHCVLDW